MAHFLFVDESGHDLRESPLEVLAGVSVEDRDLWNLIDALHCTEDSILGLRYSAQERREIKGRKFLKKKVFRHAAQLPPFDHEERTALARRCIEQGDSAGCREVAALAQAKLAYVQEAFELCARFHCRAFASIVPPNAPRPIKDILRKDYAFLFERFFYYLEDLDSAIQGMIVFDELERSQSGILIDQMEKYFLHTLKGRTRSAQIIPQPFFVHSDLTTMIQVADLMAYVLSWGYAPHDTAEPARRELCGFAEQVKALEYKTVRAVKGNPRFRIHGLTFIRDLRGREDRAGPQKEKGSETLPPQSLQKG